MTPLRRILNRIRRRANCCWYHRQDWSRVSELAIHLLEKAGSDGKTEREISDQFTTMAEGLGVSNQDLKAL